MAESVTKQSLSAVTEGHSNHLNLQRKSNCNSPADNKAEDKVKSSRKYKNKRKLNRSLELDNQIEESEELYHNKEKRRKKTKSLGPDCIALRTRAKSTSGSNSSEPSYIEANNSETETNQPTTSESATSTTRRSKTRSKTCIALRTRSRDNNLSASNNQLNNNNSNSSIGSRKSSGRTSSTKRNSLSLLIKQGESDNEGEIESGGEEVQLNKTKSSRPSRAATKGNSLSLKQEEDIESDEEDDSDSGGEEEKFDKSYTSRSQAKSQRNNFSNINSTRNLKTIVGKTGGGGGGEQTDQRLNRNTVVVNTAATEHKPNSSKTNNSNSSSKNRSSNKSVKTSGSNSSLKYNNNTKDQHHRGSEETKDKRDNLRAINKKIHKKISNLGARLARNNGGGGGGGSNNIGGNSNRGTGSDQSNQQFNQQTTDQQEHQHPPPSSNLLRRSSRGKSSTQTVTTGSCVSSGSTTSSSQRASHRNHNKNNLVNLENATNSKSLLAQGGGPSTSSATGAMASDGGGGSGAGNNNRTNVEATTSSKIKNSLTSPTNDLNIIHVLGQAGTSNNASGAHSTNNIPPPPSTPSNHPDSESDDNEVGRLQALLEARGLPPHLFGALGPRMHHLLHRTMGTSSSSKAQQLLQGLQAQDESQQLQAAIEMCQMLVMGNEDTLSGFPIKQVVPALITLLRMEHNFDIMNNACRALAYMLEALPRSSLTVVDAIPVFLEKLQVIQCMDVAEQSLTALEILSRRHNKAILQANGVSACLTYLDFFSINAQRAALSITANCCLSLHSEEFHFVNESLPLLARLLAQQDKKCVESVCTAFTRLVDSFQNDSAKLQEIASMDLLKNCQQLLIITPSILNSGTFTNVVRMLSSMCANCPDLAITLLKNDIASTLLYLLTGSSEPITNGDVELVARSPSELYEITCLIGELMPRLPSDGIFGVDTLLDRPQLTVQDQVQWQWRDDRGVWHSYSSIDSKMIEAAHLNSDDEISLITLGRTYTIDFHSMQQINEDTGTTRPVQRKINPIQNVDNVPTTEVVCNGNNEPSTINLSMRISNPYRDARIACLKEERGLAAEFIKNLFSVLYEVYSSSAGPAVRYKCLRALLRMVYFANADLLKEILKNQLVSSHIAGMMASNDLRIVVGSLQMAEILMQKLPEVFSIHFRREGVMYQITQLTDPNLPICANTSPKPAMTSSSAPPSATSMTTAFDFDAVATTASAMVKGAGGHSKNVMMMNPKVSITMPSTSGTTLASSLPSTSSNILAMNMGKGNHFHIETPPHSLPPSNSSILFSAMYSAQNAPIDGSLRSVSSSSASNYHLAHESMISEGTTNDHRSSSPGQNKMSDILKRKVPPKRKSQSSGRTKSRQEEATPSSSLTQSSVLQELITTTLGTSGRNTPSSSSNSRSRFSSGTSKTTSFLASLNPVRWGRNQGSHSTSFSKENTTTSLSKTPSNSNLIAAGNREKTRQWIRDQSISFVNRYSDQEAGGVSQHPASSILARLSGVINKLEGNAVDCLNALRELHDILIESDISPFEVNHSGLIRAMLNFMAVEQGLVTRDNRLRSFLHVFAGLPLDPTYSGQMTKVNSASFNAFVNKLNGCVTQLEQFPVKVHDFPAGIGGRSNTSALKFFNTHQLKCNLQRHPDCTNLRQWKGGTVKIDPLALVQAIERYLVVRGYGGIRVDSEEDSEEDIDDTVAAAVMSQSGFKHKLQFLIGDHVLPYNMTVYQAIKQYSPLVNDQSETDTDSEAPIGNASVWVQQHTIYYRPIEDDSNSSGSKSSLNLSRRGKGSISKIFRRHTEIWVEGSVPTILTPLTKFLTTLLPADIVMVQDASLDVLCMLRIVNGLNRHWNTLYQSVPPQLIINQSEFIHSKIAAKANRQLQDPLVIMTGNLPQWLQQIATACPFLFPFETRHLLFYAISFDRDRALQRLLDTTPDLNSSDTSERVTPRLDKRKRAISRDDILKQAEHIIQDYGHSKALLEIQYENEVGTGLGPTLEFYALVSAELQRCDLGLWNEHDSYKRTSSYISDIVKTNQNSIDNELVSINNSNNSGGGNLVHHEGSINMLIEQSDNNYMIATNQTEEYNIDNSLIVQTMDEVVHSTPNPTNQLPTPTAPVAVPVVTYVNPPNGLFPAPIGKSAKLGHISRIKTKYRFLGKFMAKAVMDSRMLDLPFSIPFYRWLLCEENSLSITDLAQIVPEVQQTLIRLQEIVKQRDLLQNDPNLDVMEKTERIESLDLDGCPIADLGLDFVLPGHADIELRRGGRDIPVTIHNLHQYISLVSHWFLVEGVYRQFEALREGFETVFAPNRLKLFYPEELENVFCGSGVLSHFKWDVRMLQDNCRTDHGFNQDSKAIEFFYDILSTYDRDEQRMFLQFITGSPRLPTGGFKSLTPPLTIVRKTMDCNQNPDDYLPSVMTCVNYLKLPEYTSREVMRLKLKMAANEGSMSFHLS